MVMALKLLVAVGALSFVTCQDIGIKKDAGTLGAKADTTKVTAVAEAAPTVIGGTKYQNLPVDKAVVRSTPAGSNAESSSSFSGLFTLLMIAIFVTAIVMLTPTSRNALITAGVVSADSEITKMSLKASSDLDPIVQKVAEQAKPIVEQAMPIVQQAADKAMPVMQQAADKAMPIVQQAAEQAMPMMQQAAAAMGILSKSNKEFDEEETCKPLINESDGEDEDEAEMKVNVNSLSRTSPMQNVSEMAFNEYNPHAPSLDAQVHLEDMIDFGQENHDDFFDEDDDF